MSHLDTLIETHTCRPCFPRSASQRVVFVDMMQFEQRISDQVTLSKVFQLMEC